MKDAKYYQAKFDLFHGKDRFKVLDVGKNDKNYHKKIIVLCIKHNNVVQSSDYKSKPSECKECLSEVNTRYSISDLQAKSDLIFENKYKILDSKDGILTMDCLKHKTKNFVQRYQDHKKGSTPKGCLKCTEESKKLHQIKNEKVAIERIFKEIKEELTRRNHIYKILEVFFVTIGEGEKKQRVPKALLQCTIHKDENGKYHEIEKNAYGCYLGKSNQCPECASQIQRENRTITIQQLKDKIANSENKVIKENHHILDFKYDVSGNIITDDFGNNQVELRCSRYNHKSKFNQSATNIGIQIGCLDCLKIKKKKDANFFSVEVNEKLKKYNLLEDFEYNNKIDRDKNDNILVNLICKSCEKPFVWCYKTRIHTAKCENCNSGDTIGESKIEKILKNNKIKFDKQKNFKGMRYKQPLFCDFYLPNYNLVVEYDGHLHFEPVEYMGGQKTFEKTQNRDAVKNKYCLENDINILRIPYWHYLEIEMIISKYIDKIISGEKIHKINFAQKRLELV